MSPGMDNEGFRDEPMQNGVDSASESGENDSHVTVIGAGPAGLMLA